MIVPVVISPAKSCLPTESCIKADGLLCCSQKGRFTWLCRSAAAYAPEPLAKIHLTRPESRQELRAFIASFLA